MLHWMLMPLKRYADFSGRSRRKEFWMYFLFNTAVAIALVGLAIVSLLFSASSAEQDGGVPVVPLIAFSIFGLWALATAVPNIAVSVRRFHDQDYSGWMYLISFIPYLGGMVLLVFMCLPGTSGPNRFGSDPKGVETLSQVFE